MWVFRCRVCSAVVAPYTAGDEDQYCADHPEGSVEVVDLPSDLVQPPATEG